MRTSEDAALSRAETVQQSETYEILQRGIEGADLLFGQIFQALSAWLPRVTEHFAAAAAAGGISGSQLAGWAHEAALELLRNPQLKLYGAGCCALAPTVVRDGNPLAWWQGPEHAQLAAATFGPGQAAIDIARLEWFRIPRETGERHVAGPFVDYLCSNEVTVTASVPVISAGQFLGVACVDLLVSALEDALLPYFGAAPLTLINSAGRIVITTNPALSTGDRWSSGCSVSELLAQGKAIRSAETPFVLVSDT